MWFMLLYAGGSIVALAFENALTRYTISFIATVCFLFIVWIATLAGGIKLSDISNFFIGIFSIFVFTFFYRFIYPVFPGPLIGYRLVPLQFDASGQVVGGSVEAIYLVIGLLILAHLAPYFVKPLKRL